MEKLKVKTFVDSFMRLEDIVRCAVCLDVVQLEMVQCTNGHLLCSECKTDLNECPTCMSAFSQEKPSRIITQFVEALPRCQHKNCETYLDTDDKDHEKYCGFKTTACKLSQCNWTGPRKDIVNHIKAIHHDVYFPIEITSACFPCDKDISSVVVYSPILAYNTFFWEKRSLDSETKTFFFTFFCVPNGKPPKDLFVELKLKSKTKSTSFSCKIQLDFDPDIDDKGNIIYVPYKAIPDFIDDNYFIYEVYITDQ